MTFSKYVSRQRGGYRRHGWNSLIHDMARRRLRCRAIAARRRRPPSGRARRDFTVEAVAGVMRPTDLPAALWPFLVIGRHTRVGKGATEGFGRFLPA
jgi:hypothetical protein